MNMNSSIRILGIKLRGCETGRGSKRFGVFPILDIVFVKILGTQSAGIIFFTNVASVDDSRLR